MGSEPSGAAGTAGAAGAGPTDTDDDGLAPGSGIDGDGDGVVDGVDVDGDGIADGQPIDVDGDGVFDGLDTDGDGVIDAELPGVAGDPVTDPMTEGPGAGNEPGRVPLRRLTATEYQNSVRDLLGVTLRPTLPEDASKAGFDNLAEASVYTPAHAVAYESAAYELVDEALGGSGRAAVIACEVAEAACRATSLEAFMSRAWRRPAEPAELAAWSAKYDELIGMNASAEEAFGMVLAGVLQSPNFIYHVEVDPAPTSVVPHPLDPYELASRLSYFLWSSTPDDALLAAAASGLGSDADIQAQVARMLGDARASAIVDNFGEQWLHQRRLTGYSPSAQEYPAFSPGLGEAFRAETRTFFEHVYNNDLPVTELLSANYSFLNPALEAHYAGESSAASPADPLTRTPLPAGRLGLLTHASLLTANAEPDRSSIVKRGVWVMGNLLCDEPPPPPGVIPALDETVASGDIQNQKDRLALHASQPQCAGCHSLFDPAGAAFENYDGIGQFRTEDAGETIDATGTVAGIAFDGAVDFATKLAADPRFVTCLAEKLMIYGLGRDVRSEDHPYLTSAAAAAGADPSLEALIANVALSEPFRLRRGEAQ